MRILLLNDTTDWYHFGCTATSTALINKLKKLGHKVTPFPITEIYKIKSTPKTKKEFINHQKFDEFTSDNSDLVNLIQSHDAIIINGEGTIHGLNPAPTSLLYVAYISKTRFGKHVEILNHSAYPEHTTKITNSNEAEVYQLVYSIIDFAAIREPISYTTMKKININAAECFDCMPLYIRDSYLPNREIITKDKDLILLAGSATWVQIHMLSAEKGNIKEYHEGLTSLSKFIKFLNKEGKSVEFLYGAKEYPSKDDQEFLEFFKRDFHVSDEMLPVYEAKNLDDWLSKIESSSLLISGRFHHTIAAACLGTQFITLNSNTPKIEGIVEVLNADQVLNYKQLSFDRLKLSFDSSHDSYTPRLKFLADKSEHNFDGLKKHYFAISGLAISEIIELSPSLSYILDEIILPLTSLNTSSKELFAFFPQSDYFWISSHFLINSISFASFFSSFETYPKVSLLNKILLPLSNTLGFATKLSISNILNKASSNRIEANLLSAPYEDQELSLFSECLAEVALSSFTSFIFSLPTALSFTSIGVSYVVFSTLSTTITSSLNCAASNKRLLHLENSSTTAGITPYIVDTVVAISMVNKLGAVNIFSTSDAFLLIKKASFITSSIVITDQSTKAIIQLIPDEYFEYVDNLFNSVFSSNTDNHSEL